MRAPRLLAAAAALLLAVLPARADQILPQGRIIGSDPANGDILFGGLKFGKRQSGKTLLQPDAVQILGSGSTGDASSFCAIIPGLSGCPSLATYLADLPLTPRTINPGACSGTGDDTATLQTLAARYRSTGQRVYFPGGLSCRIAATIVFMPPAGSGIAKPPPSITLDKSAKITATAAMTSMFDFGSDASDYSGLVTAGIVEGGVFDAAGLAGIGVRVPFLNNATVRNVRVIDAQVASIKFGSSSAPASSYEGFFESVTTGRTGARGLAPAGSACVAYENTGDSHGLNSVLNGCQTGVSGPNLYNSKFVAVHTWNFVEAGPMSTAFDLGGNIRIIGGQLDGPFATGFHFRGAGNSVIGSEVNYNSYGGTDNVANIFQLDTGATVKTFGNSWNGSAGYRIASEVVGNTSGYQAFGNTATYVVNTAGDRSPVQAKAWVQFNGATGAIADQVNVSSITRNGVGDYTVNIARDMTNTNYALALSGYSDGNAANGILVFEAPTRGRYSFRIRTYDPVTAQFADSSHISVTIFGNDTP